MDGKNEIAVKIRFFSTLKNITNKDVIEYNFSEKPRLLDILIKIQEEEFIPKNSRLLDSSNSSLDTGIICLINDADISLTGGIRQKIKKSGKEITLISSLHGG